MTDQPVTLVDLMALAIARADGSLSFDALDDLGPVEREHYIDLATAALEAGRPPERPIILDTTTGQAALLRIPPALADPPRCDACPDRRTARAAGVALRLRLAHFADADADLMHLCGSCLTRGLAIALARGRGIDVPDDALEHPDGAIPDRRCTGTIDLEDGDRARCTLTAGHASPHSYVTLSDG